MVRRLLLAFFFLMWAMPIGASDFSSAFAGVEPVSDEELGAAQGKFILPSGIEVAMAVQTDTSVNGALLLRSVFVVNNGPPALSVYAPAGNAPVQPQADDASIAATGATTGDTGTGTGITAGATTASAGNGSGSGNVSVVLDRASGITMIRTAGSVEAPKVSIGGRVDGDLADGLTQIALPADGSAAAPEGGQISVQTSDRGAQVILASDTLSVNHLFGQSYGAIVANTGSDRVIDTAVNISIELSNVNAANAGSVAARIEGLALDSLRGLLR